HRDGRWRLVTVAVSGGPVRELSVGGAAFAPPAWTPDGARVLVATDASGIWNLASVDARAEGPPFDLTRVTGAASAPAPTPDGRELFFCALTAKGVDVQRMALPANPLAAVSPASPVSPAPPGTEASLVLPPPASEAPAPRQSDTPAPAPYRAGTTQAVRLFSGFTLGPDGHAWQAGVQGTDVVGRLDWIVAASFGNAAGPRGAVLAAAWKGLPVQLDVHVFSSLEKPGSQHLAARPELDEQRYGGYAGGSWQRPFAWGRVGVEAGGGWTHIETFAPPDTFGRALGSVKAEGAFRRRGDPLGFGLDTDLSGSFGATAGASWRQFYGEARAIGYFGPLRLSVAGQYGDTGGDPTGFDVFWLGGASSAILPRGLDRNRIESPALPDAVQVGRRFEGWRAEATLWILTLYAQRGRAYDPPAKPPAVEVYGGEVRLGRLVPAELGRGLDLYLGLAKIRSTAPLFDSWRGYAGLIYRP
ncbi:MAG: TolB family protein, partial [Thermoanaerobaculia bacterium]